MGLKGILSVAGKGGLFKVVAQTKNGFVVESMANGKREPVNSTHQISMLEDISVFTRTEDLPLKEVFTKIKSFDTEYSALDLKGNPDVLRSFFEKVIPEYDQSRVYNSDIKKILSWYALIKDILDTEDNENEAADKISKAEGAKESDHTHIASKVKTSDNKASAQRSRTKV